MHDVTDRLECNAIVKKPHTKAVLISQRVKKKTEYETLVLALKDRFAQTSQMSSAGCKFESVAIELVKPFQSCDRPLEHLLIWPTKQQPSKSDNM